VDGVPPQDERFAPDRIAGRGEFLPEQETRVEAIGLPPFRDGFGSSLGIGGEG
jgi:hypothetical protein